MNLDLLNVKPVVTFTYRLTKDDIVKLFQEQLKEQLGDVPLQGDVKLDGEAVVVTLSIAEQAQAATPAQAQTVPAETAPIEAAPAVVSPAEDKSESLSSYEALSDEDDEPDDKDYEDFEPMQLGLDSSLDDDF
ncbi:MAG: hypothetical protein ROM54_11420 [Anaerobiospirillum sp.]|nr:hypothetical protein [Anaerobiospirillum sp.]